MSTDTSELIYRPPAWATGNISSTDARFLANLVREIGSTPVVEIGVASGCSSGVLLQAAEAYVDAARRAEGPWLISFDVAERCYFDASRSVGAAVDDMASALRRHWQLNVGDAVAARRLARTAVETARQTTVNDFGVRDSALDLV